LSAFLAEKLLARGNVDARADFAAWLDEIDWENDVARPFRELTSLDLRTGPILKHVLWNWAFPGPRVSSLERQYRRWISARKLGELPSYPEFVFCATDLTFGVNWIFTRERAGDYKAGYFSASEWPIARAVAASSCFPPLFGPMPARVPEALFAGGDYDGEDREALVSRLALTDGGVYDNLGLEPAWKSRDVVLVSDCGAPFELSVAKNPVRRLLRYVSVVMNQASSVRKRMFFAQREAGAYRGTYWSIRTAAELPDDPKSLQTARGYPRDVVDGLIAEVRTDLDSFTEAEAKILENHGYFAAERSLSLYFGDSPSPGIAPRAPNPEWMDRERVEKALAESARRVSVKRWLRVRRERASREP
jgi:NTE family protein